MIAIIDYEMGNIGSIMNALDYLKLEYIVTDDATIILKADKIILPGVGAFRDAITRLHNKGLFEVIKQVQAANKPILGICLGFQLLFQKSYENGEYEGLGFINASITKLNVEGLKIPQIGWNSLQLVGTSPLFKEIAPESMCYFVHSYACLETSITAASSITNYGLDFVSSVNLGNVYGLQFHPEKSGEVGLKILKNFGEL